MKSWLVDEERIKIHWWKVSVKQAYDVCVFHQNAHPPTPPNSPPIVYSDVAFLQQQQETLQSFVGQ